MLFVASQVLVLFWDCSMSDKNSQQDKGKGMLEGLAINDNNNLRFSVHECSTFS